MTRTKLTPPAIARLWGVAPEKVLGWIHAGELPAINAATHPGGRPRYLVDLADLALFEARRAVTPPPRASTRPRKPKGDVIQFF